MGRWAMNRVKNDEKIGAQAHLPIGVQIRREVIAWFWVGLVFLLINGRWGRRG